jgi:hypothetical protein
MQIFAVCMECQKELGHPSFEPFFLPYYENRLVEIECSRRHKSVLLLQSQKFTRVLLAHLSLKRCGRMAHYSCKSELREAVDLENN